MDLPNLERLSVKELRKHAAIRNVPLTSIAAAVEKRELINMILCAAPVLDQYDINGAPKVHSAESLAAANMRPKDKKKKKRHRSSSSSSSSSGGRRKKKKKKGRKKRSPSITIITPPMKGLPSTLDLTVPMGVPSAAAVKGAAAATAFLQRVEKPPIVVPSAVSPAIKQLTNTSEADKAAAKAKTATLAQKGMAAAAALGYDVLPKAAQSSLPAAPMEGLRPSVNPPGTGVPVGQYGNPGSIKRVCVNYMMSAKCDLGANCPDAHILDPEEEMHIRAKFKQQECHYGAACTRAGCLFRHPGEKCEEFNFIPAGQGVTMRVDNKTGELALDFI